MEVAVDQEGAPPFQPAVEAGAVAARYHRVGLACHIVLGKTMVRRWVALGLAVHFLVGVTFRATLFGTGIGKTRLDRLEDAVSACYQG